MKKLEFESEFFDLYKLSDSAYGAISKENSGMGGNAGFIDIGDYLIIVDTTGHVNAAKDLKRAANQYTQKEPNFIVITHYHMDHLMGTSLFDISTQIMTSDRTLKNIQTEGRKRIEEFKKMDLKEMEDSLNTETDEEKRKDIENDLFFLKTVRSDDFTVREPNLTFKEGCVIHGTEKNVQLRTFKKAHTDGDVIVYIPEEKILFAGDLLFARRDPWLGSGDPEGWISVNEELLALDFKVTVPGHGELASKEEFSLESKYIKEILELVKKKIDAGEDPTQIKMEDFSKEIQSWKSPILEWNIKFLVDVLKNS
ncbi:MAG: MBL fold metallo-hydrolase [Candidatus Lokiarchaeota archaeon]|nr:MBL fold metallo-hydrolase [Candidatus Lokiarchaeota archaeon]